MLNPWLAITFQTMRLGFEAQNAVTLRLMRLVGDASKTEARSMVVDKAAMPPDAQEAATKVASDSDRRREAPKSIKSECAPTSAGTLNNKYPFSKCVVVYGAGRKDPKQAAEKIILTVTIAESACGRLESERETLFCFFSSLLERNLLYRLDGFGGTAPALELQLL
jgi:hypothetical protein